MCTLWYKEKVKKVGILFFRLNMIDKYSFGMGYVDQSDQLRLQYCSTYWPRNYNWWWDIFFWTCKSSYKNWCSLYHKFYKIHSMMLPCNHYTFICTICLVYLDPKKYWPSKKLTQLCILVLQQYHMIQSSLYYTHHHINRRRYPRIPPSQRIHLILVVIFLDVDWICT